MEDTSVNYNDFSPKPKKNFFGFDKNIPLGKWNLPPNYLMDEIKGQHGKINYRIGYKTRPWRNVFYISGIFGLLLMMAFYSMLGGGRRHSFHRHDIELNLPVLGGLVVLIVVSAIISYFAFMSLYIDVSQDEFKFGYGMSIPMWASKKMIRDELVKVEVSEELNGLEKLMATISGSTNKHYSLYYVRKDVRIFLMKVDSDVDLATYKEFFEALVCVEV